MRLRGILLTVATLASLLLLVVNWRTATFSLPVDFLLFAVELPLGLVLLGVALVLSLFFFLASLMDHARQLRQISQLERQNETLRGRLERRRQEEIEALDRSHQLRCDALEERFERSVGELETRLRGDFEAYQGRLGERLDTLLSRVTLVRDELAADIAEAEDMFRRELKGEGAE